MHNGRNTLVAGGISALAMGVIAGGLALPASARDMTQTRLENAAAEPDNWLHVNGNYSAHRFANLTQINKDNVGQLKVKMMLLLAGQSPAIGGRYQVTRLEGTPLAEDGFLYITDGWGALYKVDIRSGNRADFVWKMDPQVDKVWAGDVACCGVDNRGAALWKDLVVTVALDGRLIGTNKETGEVKWENKIADPANAETLTVAPQIIRDIGVVGIAGAEYGIRGFLEGTDLNTGKSKWRTHTAGGNDRDPNEKAKATWLDNYKSWETGGGSIWQTGTYDPKLNLMYWGTGNAGPDYDQEYRPGDNLYAASVLAMNPDDGFIKWFFQYTPGDPYDYDEIGEHPLIDIDIGGKPMQLVTHPGRNGFFYGFDRTNGQFLYGKQYPNVVTWTDGIDPKTGKPLSYVAGAPLQHYNAGTVATRDGKPAQFCGAITGGKNWEPSTYSPVTKTLYTDSAEGCTGPRTVSKLDNFTDKTVAGVAGTVKKRTSWTGATNAPAGTPNPNPLQSTRYSLNAISPVDGHIINKVMYDSKIWGVASTAGGLVFGGNYLGDFMAWDAATLAPLWTFNVGTPIGGPPMSFAYQGKQYVAILAGSAAGASEQAQRPGTKFFTPSNYLFLFGL